MIVEGNSIAEVWLKALALMVDRKVSELTPFIANIKISEKIFNYTDDLESDLNEFLNTANQPPIGTTASTIFPVSLANGNTPVFDRFERIWKYVKHDGKNRNGHYFRRLMAYNEQSGEPVNQLKHIINTYNGIKGVRKAVHRRSALIATTFDPTLDHTAQPQRGFPCLQQVCFVPRKKDSTLAINAIYAMQYLSDRAYGNYLGIQRLGQFMAKEMGLELNEVNCVASVLNIGKMNKATAKQLMNKYIKYV